MIAVPFTPVTSTAVLVAINATDEAAWSGATTYALSAVVSKNKRRWVSLQAGNLNHDPEELDSLWWTDDGPSNQWAMFDTSVQTATTRSGGLEFTLATGRATAVGLMGLSGANTATITVRDGLGGAVIYTNTKTLATSGGSYYGFCFEPLQQLQEAVWYSLLGSINSHITITLAGPGTVACGLCVFGRQIDVGNAEYGFSVATEDRGRQYLDRLGNPVTIERGYSKGASGTVHSSRAEYNRLMAFIAANINTPCLWVAAPDQADLVAATVFGRFTRAVPAISEPNRITAAWEIAGYR